MPNTHYPGKILNAGLKIIRENKNPPSQSTATIFLLGATRVGKTSLIKALQLHTHHLIPKLTQKGELRWPRIKLNMPKDKKGVMSDTTISSNHSIAETLLEVTDSPGLLDNRDGVLLPQKVAATIDLVYSLRSAKKLRVLTLCFSYSSFLMPDGSSLRKVLAEQVSLIDDVSRLQDHLHFVITRPCRYTDRNEQYEAIKQALEQLLEYFDQNRIEASRGTETEQHHTEKKCRQIVCLMLGRSLSDTTSTLNSKSEENAASTQLNPKLQIVDICKQKDLNDLIALWSKGLTLPIINTDNFLITDKTSHIGEVFSSLQAQLDRLGYAMSQYASYYPVGISIKDIRPDFSLLEGLPPEQSTRVSEIYKKLNTSLDKLESHYLGYQSLIDNSHHLMAWVFATMISDNAMLPFATRVDREFFINNAVEYFNISETHNDDNQIIREYLAQLLVNSRQQQTSVSSANSRNGFYHRVTDTAGGEHNKKPLNFQHEEATNGIRCKKYKCGSGGSQ